MFFFKAGKSKNLVTDYVYRSNHGDRADRGRAGSIDSGRSFCSDTTHFYCVCTYAVKTGELLRSGELAHCVAKKKKKHYVVALQWLPFMSVMKISRPSIELSTENSVTDPEDSLADDIWVVATYNGPRGPRVLRLAELADFSFHGKSFHLGVREPRPQLSKIGTA